MADANVKATSIARDIAAARLGVLKTITSSSSSTTVKSGSSGTVHQKPTSNKK
jgi:hypothetical protein